MKKFLAIFLVLTLLFSFAACNKDVDDGESTTTPVEQTSENGVTNKNEPSSSKQEKPTAPPFNNPNLTVPEALFELVNVNDYTLNSRKPNSSATSGDTTLGKRYERKQMMTTVIPNKITAGSTEIIIMQTTVRELIDKGWAPIGKTDINKAVKQGKGSLAFFKNDQGKMLSFNVANNTTNILALADCTIVGVSWLTKMNVEYDWVELVLGDKCGTTSSYADIIDEMGMPYTITVKEKYHKNDYVECEVTLLYEYKASNIVYDVNIAYTDKNGQATLDSFIVTAK